MIRHIFPTKTAYGCSPLLYGYHSGMSRRTDKEEGQATIANKDKVARELNACAHVTSR